MQRIFYFLIRIQFVCNDYDYYYIKFVKWPKLEKLLGSHVLLLDVRFYTVACMPT
jgi:hypothetical protein